MVSERPGPDRRGPGRPDNPRQCPVCHSTDLTVVVRLTLFVYFECSVCHKLVRLDNPNSPLTWPDDGGRR